MCCDDVWSVWRAGPQPRSWEASVACRCVPDLNRDHGRPVLRAGPQLRSWEASVACRTSTAIMGGQCCVYLTHVRKNVRRYVRKTVRNNVRKNVRRYVRKNVGKNVRRYARRNVRKNVRSFVKKNLRQMSENERQRHGARVTCALQYQTFFPSADSICWDAFGL